MSKLENTFDKINPYKEESVLDKDIQEDDDIPDGLLAEKVGS